MRDFWSYCLQSGGPHCNPFAVNPDPIIAAYWIHARAVKLGNCNAIRSWTSALTHWGKIHFEDQTFYVNKRYNNIVNMVKSKYTRDHVKTPKKPVLFIMIVDYLKYMKCTPGNYETIDLNVLKQCWFLLIAFFSISRPFELTRTDQTIDDLIEVITTGLRWGHIKYINSLKYINSYLELLIHWYKNQTDRQTPKTIYMAPPVCEHEQNCLCRFVDFVKMFIVLKRRCKNFYNEQLTKIKRRKQQNGYSTQADLKFVKNNKVGQHNYVFVGQKGEIWGPNKLNEIVKHMVKVLNIPKPDAYTGYCVKVGAVSLCRQQELDILKVIRYVQWSVNNAPHVIARYIAYSCAELRIIPFEMVHGRNRPNGRCKNKRSDTKLKVQALWSADVERIFFK